MVIPEHYTQAMLSLYHRQVNDAAARSARSAADSTLPPSLPPGQLARRAASSPEDAPGVSLCRASRPLAQEATPPNVASSTGGQHTPDSIDFSLDMWWKVTGDWRAGPIEVLPKAILQSLLSHTWTEPEEGQDNPGEVVAPPPPAESGPKRWGVSLSDWSNWKVGRVVSFWKERSGGEEQEGREKTVDEMRVEVEKLCASLVAREVLTVAPVTLYPKPSTLNPQPSTLNPQPSTLNPQPSTLNPQS